MRDPEKGQVAGLSWWMPRSLQLLSANMLTSDDPDHRRLRGVVDEAFRRKPVEAMGEGIAIEARQLLAATDSGSFNLVSNYARPLPLRVIADLLGIPTEDLPVFARQATRLTGVRSFWTFISMLPAVSGLRRTLVALVDRMRSDESVGRDGLIRHLLHVSKSGETGEEVLSDDELIAMVFLLLIAGHETTSHAISTSVLALERHPEQKAAFLEMVDPAMAVEELLRFNSPVQLTKPRFVVRDCEMEGVTLKRGDKIMAWLGAANRDPAVFDNPDELDLNRKPNPHLQFGTGIHFCLGFQLARKELAIGLQELYRARPGLSLQEQPVWRESFGLRALDKLLVR